MHLPRDGTLVPHAYQGEQDDVGFAHEPLLAGFADEKQISTHQASRLFQSKALASLNSVVFFVLERILRRKKAFIDSSLEIRFTSAIMVWLLDLLVFGVGNRFLDLRKWGFPVLAGVYTCIATTRAFVIATNAENMRRSLIRTF
eukprot:6492771-Amphidinium_carterae.2